MPKAIFIEHDGRRIEAEVPVGISLMRAAADHGVKGILGDCGGVVSCATCHVFVESPFLELLPPVSEQEEEMLDFTAAPKAHNSRLSCQIVMTEQLDELTVRVAYPQA
jgi:ferredoxin, 2Fe-2S